MAELDAKLRNPKLTGVDRMYVYDEYANLQRQPYLAAHPVQAFFFPEPGIPGIGGTSPFEQTLIGGLSVAQGYRGLCTPTYHGNDLRSSKPAIGYSLRDRTSGELLKYGETTQGNARYTKAYLNSVNARMLQEASGTKAEMHDWQHDQILNFKNQNSGQPAAKQKRLVRLP